jgi:HPt (histidine-containing phosphotransfer) domain-containing protein
MTIVDWNAALDAVNSDQELLLEVIAILQQELPALHSELQQAVASRDTEAQRRTAHKLKGSVRFLGTTKVHTIAEQLELMDSNEALKGDELCAELSMEIEKLTLELKAYVEAKQA